MNNADTHIVFHLQCLCRYKRPFSIDVELTVFHFLQTWSRAFDLMVGGTPWTWREVRAAAKALAAPQQPTRPQQQQRPQQPTGPQQPPPRVNTPIEFWPLEVEEEDVIVID